MEPDTISVTVPNAILFLHDPSFWDFPEPQREGAVWCNGRGITMSCLPEMDGLTDITIGSNSKVQPTNHLIFDGELQTPTRKVRVLMVLGGPILEQTVSNARTRVRIWTDGYRDTATVVIGLE